MKNKAKLDRHEVSTKLAAPVVEWVAKGWYSIRVIFVDGVERFVTRYHGEETPPLYYNARYFNSAEELADYANT